METTTAADLTAIDLTGARLRMVRVADARLRMVDAANVVVRDADLSGASIDGANVDGLTINGVEVGPLIDAELARREPARALRRATDPAELRQAWQLITESWERTYADVAEGGAPVDASVDDEWSFVETLRHLVFATDAWLGVPLGNAPRYHPWGVPFSDYEEFVPGGADALGLDVGASPSYDDVLRLRRDRVAQVRDWLASADAGTVAAEVTGPPWAGDDPVTLLRCLWVVLDEEIEHHRFARRDLDMLRARPS